MSMNWRNPDVPSKRYATVISGVPFEISLPYRLLLQCCGCGLVDEMKFKRKGERVEVTMRTLKAETKKVREQARVKRNIDKLRGGGNGGS